jgi:stage V sporulation protein G
MEDPDDRLRAFCSVTFDNCFVVRDLKIIEGATGPFVAMPSRKLTGHCGKCGGKNHLRANFCNQCGARLREQPTRDGEGRAKLYADIAHPINSQCREQIQNRVIEGFRAELERSGQPGYVSRYDEEYDEGDYEPGDYDAAGSQPDAQAREASDQPDAPAREAAPGTPASDRTLRADAPQEPAGPHVPEERPTEKSPAQEPPSTAPRQEPPKTAFGEGIFEEDA